MQPTINNLHTKQPHINPLSWGRSHVMPPPGELPSHTRQLCTRRIHSSCEPTPQLLTSSHARVQAAANCARDCPLLMHDCKQVAQMLMATQVASLAAPGHHTSNA